MVSIFDGILLTQNRHIFSFHSTNDPNYSKMFIQLLSTIIARCNNNNRLNGPVRRMCLLENSFNRSPFPLLPLYFFLRFIRARLARAHGRGVANGPLGNNRQGNEHSEMAHLIVPLRQYIDTAPIVLLLLPGTTRIPDIIEPQELASTYCINGVCNWDHSILRPCHKTLHLPMRRMYRITPCTRHFIRAPFEVLASVNTAAKSLSIFHDITIT